MSIGGSGVITSCAGSLICRFTTRPNAPCGPYSASSTTVRAKFGSSICGIDTSRTGAKESSAIAHILAPQPLLRPTNVLLYERRLGTLRRTAYAATGTIEHFRHPRVAAVAEDN